jgi:FkbM family methyltransferase
MTRITIVDVGARVGPRPEWMRNDCEIIGFEPDEAECRRLRAAYPSHTFVALALDSEPRTRTFYVTAHEQCSSFYRPKQDLVSRGIVQHRLDRETVVDTTTLDVWWAEHGHGRPIDLLKLDTQGSELDILKGAMATLTDVVLVMSEVCFNPFYEEQPLFGDVDRWLRGRGFELLALQDLNYCWNQLYWCDAYWTRVPMSARAMTVATEVCGVSLDHPEWWKPAGA